MRTKKGRKGGGPEFVYRAPPHHRCAQDCKSTVAQLTEEVLVDLKDALVEDTKKMSASVQMRLRISAAERALDRLRKQHDRIVRKLRVKIKHTKENLKYAEHCDSPVPVDAAEKALNAEMVTCVQQELRDFVSGLHSVQ